MKQSPQGADPYAFTAPKVPPPGGNIPLQMPGEAPPSPPPVNLNPPQTVPPDAPVIHPRGPLGRSPQQRDEVKNRESGAKGVQTTNGSMPPPIASTSSHADSIMHTKMAAVPPWVRFTGERVIPSVALGAGEGYLNYELDPSHPATAVLGGILGAYGGSKLRSPDPMSRRLAPYMTAGGALIPRAISATAASAEASHASSGLIKTLSALSTPTAVGGGILGLAALAALYQGTRAAKRVGDGEPLVNASTSNNVYAGGSGGTENPNMGGKVRVTLPTRHAGDNETQVEFPMENMPMSGAIIDQIRRDTKRRLRTEGASRTIHPGAAPTTMKSLMSV